MSEVFLGHIMISFERTLQILFMNSQAAPHEKMLRSFNYVAVNSEQVRFFQSLEAKVIIGIIPFVVNF